MTKALFENLLDQLEQDFTVRKNHDFIGELCEERAEIMHMSIVKNQEYKQHEHYKTTKNGNLRYFSG